MPLIRVRASTDENGRRAIRSLARTSSMCLMRFRSSKEARLMSTQLLGGGGGGGSVGAACVGGTAVGGGGVCVGTAVGGMGVTVAGGCVGAAVGGTGVLVAGGRVAVSVGGMRVAVWVGRGVLVGAAVDVGSSVGTAVAAISVSSLLLAAAASSSCNGANVTSAPVSVASEDGPATKALHIVSKKQAPSKDPQPKTALPRPVCLRNVAHHQRANRWADWAM